MIGVGCGDGSGEAQSTLRIVVRPVCEHERMTVIKQALEGLVVGQSLYHMGLWDVKSNRVVTCRRLAPQPHLLSFPSLSTYAQLHLWFGV